MLGKDQPVILQLLEIPDEKAQKALKGVIMELDDCAFPLLQEVTAHSDPRTAFKDADVALLVGARPRGPGMERKDLLSVNAQIFTAQGKALNDVASRNVKVLVVGNPANTNAYIAMKSAPDLPAKNFTAMLRLDHNRALSQLAAKSGKAVADIEKLVVWGNHSPTMYPDFRFATVGGQSLAKLINDDAWNRDTFIPTVGKRGAAIIEARGLSSAASAANAAIDHVRDWVLGSNGKWVTMGVPSDGSYGIPEGIIYGVPVITENGEYKRVEGRKSTPLARAPGLHAERAARRARRREGPAEVIRSSMKIGPVRGPNSQAGDARAPSAPCDRRPPARRLRTPAPRQIHLSACAAANASQTIVAQGTDLFSGPEVRSDASHEPAPGPPRTGTPTARGRPEHPVHIHGDHPCPDPNRPAPCSVARWPKKARCRSSAPSTPTMRCWPSAPATAPSTCRAAASPPARWACRTWASTPWTTC